MRTYRQPRRLTKSTKAKFPSPKLYMHIDLYECARLNPSKTPFMYTQRGDDLDNLIELVLAAFCFDPCTYSKNNTRWPTGHAG